MNRTNELQRLSREHLIEIILYKEKQTLELFNICKDLNKELADKGYGSKATDLDDLAVELNLVLKGNKNE